MSEVGMGSVDEITVVQEARRRGVEEIPITEGQYAGTALCGTCGRIVCHPDCRRGGFSHEARVARGERMPCWTAAGARGVCSRGGIGCPLPHDGRPQPECPPELRRARRCCPVHRGYMSYGDRGWRCHGCPRWRRMLQCLYLAGWTRANLRDARAADRKCRELRRAGVID